MRKKDDKLRELNLEDLRDRLATERLEYHNLRAAHALSSIENPSKIRYVRRTIARVETLVKQKELAQ